MDPLWFPLRRNEKKKEVHTYFISTVISSTAARVLDLANIPIRGCIARMAIILRMQYLSKGRISFVESINARYLNSLGGRDTKVCARLLGALQMNY